MARDTRVHENWIAKPVAYDWRQECWQILLATGADPDGADPRHLNPGEALRAVEELRDEIRDADKDLISIHRRFNIYAGALREIAAATPSYADGWPVPDLAELVGVAATALKRGAGLHDERKADRG